MGEPQVLSATASTRCYPKHLSTFSIQASRNLGPIMVERCHVPNQMELVLDWEKSMAVLHRPITIIAFLTLTGQMEYANPLNKLEFMGLSPLGKT